MTDETNEVTTRMRAQEELQNSETRYRRLFETARDGILILDAVTGKITDVNPFMVELLGYSRDEFLGRELWEIGLFRDKEASREAFRVLQETGYIRYEDLPLETKEGARREVEFVSNVYQEDGRRVIQCNIRDITERVWAEGALKEAVDYTESIVETMREPLVILDAELRVKTANRSFYETFRVRLEETENQFIYDLGNSQWDIPGLRTLLEEILPRNSFFQDYEVDYEFPIIGRRTMLLNARRLRQGARRAGLILLAFEDITRRREAEDRMAHAASHDALTRLPNRALFIDHLQRAIARTKRHEDYLFVVLFLDLDRFKVINDSLGHVVADQLLVEIARKLESCVRPEDIVARFGGDEFTLLLDDIKEITDATRVADRIHQELATPFNLGGQEVFTTASIGVTLSSQGYDRPEEVLRDADTAMYRAKALGKARHEIFDRSMHERVMALLKLETDLRRAVERREFRVHYQPIVSLETGRISGFEALLRWQHPERGLIPPAEFIPAAEETGLIIPIGYWVLGEACRQTRVWQERIDADPPLMISVNLSSKQFLQPDLIERINQVLRKTGCDARSLKLEITESVVMENAGEATVMTRRLRDLGVGLYMDDFGTGYSSLSYLHRFPVGTLKIDRSFVNRMSARDGNSEIVRAIVALAHNLHMEVIAEGVETEEQLSRLKALRCEYGQGYYFSSPLDAGSAGKLITP